MRADLRAFQLRPTNDPEGHHGPETALSLSRRVPLRHMQVKAADFLQQHAANYNLTTVRRWGQSIADLLEAVTGQAVQTRCSHWTTLRMFRLDWIDWEPQQQKEGVTCVYAPQFFHMLGVMHWLQNNPTEHVALILVCKAAVACFNHWKMQLGQDFQERLTVGTPESVQGDTFHRTIFLPIQKRSPDEWKPHGHSCHVGRRVVGPTRASHELVVFCEWLWPSAHEDTEKF